MASGFLQPPVDNFVAFKMSYFLYVRLYALVLDCLSNIVYLFGFPLHITGFFQEW